MSDEKKMNNEEMSKVELGNEELDQVNGGTFTPALYEEEDYKTAGIKRETNFFAKDEYWLPDGTKTDEDGANAYMKANYPYILTRAVKLEMATKAVLGTMF